MEIPTLDIEEDIVGIQQHEKVCTRVFECRQRILSTYYTSEANKGKIEDPVEIQFQSLSKSSRSSDVHGRMFSFLILPIFFVYPMVRYHNYGKWRSIIRSRISMTTSRPIICILKNGQQD